METVLLLFLKQSWVIYLGYILPHFGFDFSSKEYWIIGLGTVTLNAISTGLYDGLK